MKAAITLALTLLGDAPLSSPRTTPTVSHQLVVDGDAVVDPETVDAVARACADIESTLGAPRRRVVVVLRVARDLEQFTRATGRPGFEAAAFTKDAPTKGTLWLTPKGTRERLFHLDLVYRHECVHAWLAADGTAPLPRALEEAIALKLSGQSAKLPPADPLTIKDVESAEAALAIPRDRLRYEATLARVAATFSSCVTTDRAALRALTDLATRADRPLIALIGNGGPCSPALVRARSAPDHSEVDPREPSVRP